VLIASTAKGICHLAFTQGNAPAAEAALRQQFTRATFVPQTDELQQAALQVFSGNFAQAAPITLHLKGTPFQLKVWQALLHIPLGGISTYQAIAQAIAAPKAARAAGSAIGANPAAFIIPCHRVIRSTGITGQYHWGAARKTAIIGWEAAKLGGE
jgi:AraC family transcriptional regulator of adaptative response/methylated-DNA-[protein]-cysteine methyltransferase